MLRVMDRHGNCAGVAAAAPLEVVHMAVRVARYVDRCCDVTQTASKGALPDPITFRAEDVSNVHSINVCFFASVDNLCGDRWTGRLPV